MSSAPSSEGFDPDWALSTGDYPPFPKHTPALPQPPDPSVHILTQRTRAALSKDNSCSRKSNNMETDILLQKITFLLKRRAKGDRLTEIVQNPPKHILSEHTSGVEQNGATFLLKLLLARQVDIKLSSVALVLLYRGMEEPGKPCFICQTTEDAK